MQMQSGAMVDAGGGKKGGKGKSKVNGTGKASIRKESRTYSNLIFSMEQFEKYLFQLDKKAKVNCPKLGFNSPYNSMLYVPCTHELCHLSFTDWYVQELLSCAHLFPLPTPG